MRLWIMVSNVSKAVRDHGYAWDIMINGDRVDALALIVHKDNAPLSWS